MLRQFIFLFITIIALIATIVFTIYAVQDYLALMAAYTAFEHVAGHTHDMSALFVAEARQNVFRINLFAEGVWALLSAILATLGLLGMNRQNLK